MTKEIQHRIDGIDLLLTVEDEGNTWCHLSYRPGGKYGRQEFTQSLELTKALGYFEDDNGNTVVLPRVTTLDRIEKWADANGY